MMQIALAVFGVAFMAMLVDEWRQMRARHAREDARIDALFKDWENADRAYFGYMRDLLAARQRGEHDIVDAMMPIADKLWREALVAERRAKRR